MSSFTPIYYFVIRAADLGELMLIFINHQNCSSRKTIGLKIIIITFRFSWRSYCMFFWLHVFRYGDAWILIVHLLSWYVLSLSLKSMVLFTSKSIIVNFCLNTFNSVLASWGPIICGVFMYRMSKKVPPPWTFGRLKNFKRD